MDCIFLYVSYDKDEYNNYYHLAINGNKVSCYTVEKVFILIKKIKEEKTVWLEESFL